MDKEFQEQIAAYIKDMLGNEQDNDFKQYRRKQIAELRPYKDGEQLPEKVSISQADREAGSPKVGDMIARNPKNHDDQWLVARQYFLDNFEQINS